MNNNHVYDMLVVGGGPAGYTAALYAARAGLSTLVLEKLSAGGQMALTEQIDNYPGFEDGIDGFTLGEKMQQSAERFGAVMELAEVYKASLSGRIKTLETSEGVFQSRTVVIATGASPRPLGIPGEEALTGKGVHYCAACDGAPYRGKTVAVVGGGNSAVADVLALSRIAKKAYLIHRRDSLRATKVYHQPLMAVPNVEFCWNSTVSALLHENRLTGLRLKDVNTGAEHDLACDGVFISVGRAPATELFRRELALDKSGYIIADESTRTNLPGVFAAGDVRTKGRIGRRGSCPLRGGISGGEPVKETVLRTYRDKEDLKNEIRQSFEKYISEFDTIPEALKDKRVPGVDRTPAENLAYQVGWTTLLLSWEADEKRGMDAKTPSEQFKWNQLGGLYQWFTDTYAHLSLAELKGKLCENIAAIQTMIDCMSEEELFQPHMRRWADGATKAAVWEVYKFIHVNTVAPFGTFRTKIRKWKKAAL